MDNNTYNNNNNVNTNVLTIQPEILQLDNVQNFKQLIKVNNRSNQRLENCFFCLYNTGKYQFVPDHFSLEGRESKIVAVHLKSKSNNNSGGNSGSSSKQFAYLKVKNISKRLVLLTNYNNNTNKNEHK